MTTQRAQHVIPAPLSRVRDILLQPRQLPDWNPAFLSMDGPTTAMTGRYPLVARGGLRGHLEYTAIGDADIDVDWQVPGLAEKGTWHLESHGTATLVTHQFSHRGVLTRVLHSAFLGAAELRLNRLANRAASQDTTVRRQR